MAIRFSLDGSTVWVATDGGVYRSTARGANGTFVARNDGLAVLECGYIACHPENDGGVVIGLQDNGTQRRIGETAWRQDAWGDGGGLAFDVTTPHRHVARNTDTHWSNGLGSPLRPVRRTGHPAATWKTEDDASAFYSAPSTIAVTRRRRSWRSGPTASGTRRTGARRGGRCRREGTPTSTPGPTPPRQQRARRPAGRLHPAMPLGDADRLWVMTSSALFHYQRDAAGQWAQAQLAVNPVLSRRGRRAASLVTRWPPGRSPRVGPGSTWRSTERRRRRCARHPVPGDDGVAAAADSDQLFWFDGAGRGAAPACAATTAAALAVAVEPGHAESSTSVRRSASSGPAGDGRDHAALDVEALDNGLPDVAVHDLSIYSRERGPPAAAATESRGVWELDLAGAVALRTYLRVHEYDTRRRLPTALGQPFVAKVPTRPHRPRSCPWTTRGMPPDVGCIRLQVVAAPPSLTWTGAAGKHPTPAANPTGTWRLWQFQAALRALQRASNPTDVADALDAVLRARERRCRGTRAVTTAFWNTVMTAANVAVLPWDAPRRRRPTSSSGCRTSATPGRRRAEL